MTKKERKEKKSAASLTRLRMEKEQKNMPNTGVEPITSSLLVMRSTDEPIRQMFQLLKNASTVGLIKHICGGSSLATSRVGGWTEAGCSSSRESGGLVG